MKLAKGMYVRNTYYGFGKITNTYESHGSTWYNVKFEYSEDAYDNNIGINENSIGFKANHKIINLIEENDIVETKFNGIVVILNDCNGNVYYELADHIPSEIRLTEDDIVRVLTHEQFERYCYKIGE